MDIFIIRKLDDFIEAAREDTLKSIRAIESAPVFSSLMDETRLSGLKITFVKKVMDAIENESSFEFKVKLKCARTNREFVLK